MGFDKVHAVCTRTDPSGYQKKPMPSIAVASEPANGPLNLARSEWSNPVYDKLTTRFPSTVGMFASVLPPEPYSGPAYAMLSTQYPSMISLFASYHITDNVHQILAKDDVDDSREYDGTA